MSIDWWTLGLQSVNFLVLVWLLQRFLYRPALKAIARRKELAERALNDAEMAKREAAAASQRYEDERQAFAETRQTLLQKTHTALEEERTRLLDAARAEAEQIVETGRADLETERAAMLSALREEVADLALDMAVTVMTRFAGISASGLDGALSELTGQLNALPETERNRLTDDLADPEATLRVTTAAELDEEQRERWRAALLELLPGARVQFTVDPGLIGGAELHFPHALLSAAWSELLNQSRETLLVDESAD